MAKIWEELGKAGEYDQNALHEILKELIKMRKKLRWGRKSETKEIIVH